MRAEVCHLCMFWDAIFPCFRQIPSGTETKYLSSENGDYQQGLGNFPSLRKDTVV